MKKITNLNLSDYKVYQANIEVFADKCSFSIQYDKFRDENDGTVSLVSADGIVEWF